MGRWRKADGGLWDGLIGNERTSIAQRNPRSYHRRPSFPPTDVCYRLAPRFPLWSSLEGISLCLSLFLVGSCPALPCPVSRRGGHCLSVCLVSEGYGG